MSKDYVRHLIKVFREKFGYIPKPGLTRGGYIALPDGTVVPLSEQRRNGESVRDLSRQLTAD